MVEDELDEGVADGELGWRGVLLICLLWVRWLDILGERLLQHVLPVMMVNIRDRHMITRGQRHLSPVEVGRCADEGEQQVAEDRDPVNGIAALMNSQSLD